jgi:deoxyribonuclease-2
MPRRALLVAALAASARALSCLDESGAPVAWWAVFKLHGGLDYSYADAVTPTPAGPLRLTGRSLDCGTGCALGATLSQLINNASLLRVTWNDEPAVGAAFGAASDTSGHAKGVIGADADGGFWLTHSMPKFPLLTGVAAFSWAAGGASTTYGQNFLCISVDAAELEEAAAGVAHIDPLIYASAVPAGLSRVYPVLAGVVAGARVAGAAKVAVSNTAGNAFSYFAKSGSWGKDLWEDLVQANLGVNMFVETWRRSPAMESYCTPAYAYDSVNVATMQFLSAAGEPVSFKYTQDHTKLGLAVNATSQQHWLCFACVWFRAAPRRARRATITQINDHPPPPCLIQPQRQ